MRLIILSGRSGSGKTIALRALEDLGFYCVDNLPPALLPQLEQYFSHKHGKLAVSVDARNLESSLASVTSNLKQYELIYLDAQDEVLLKRFSETRRKHPLSAQNTTLIEAIRKEHKLLWPLASMADLTVDTSSLTPHELHNIIRDRAGHQRNGNLQLLIQSFGFKYGLPANADFMFDVRCLPNPYWEGNLKELRGTDKEIIEFLEPFPKVQHMITDITKFLINWVPQFAADNRSYMTVAIGCTGGKHRSVYIAECLAKHPEAIFSNAVLRHRDI